VGVGVGGGFVGVFGGGGGVGGGGGGVIIVLAMRKTPQGLEIFHASGRIRKRGPEKLSKDHYGRGGKSDFRTIRGKKKPKRP